MLLVLRNLQGTFNLAHGRPQILKLSYSADAQIGSGGVPRQEPGNEAGNKDYRKLLQNFSSRSGTLASAPQRSDAG